jgi:hypothetical protein
VRRRVPLLLLPILVLALAGVALPVPAQQVEDLYARSVYALIQPIVTGFSSAVPVALLDVAVGLFLLSFVLLARRHRLRRVGRADPQGEGAPRAGAPRRRRALQTAFRACAWVLVASAVLYLWFLLFWGLNYRRVPLERKLAYDASRVTRAQAMTFGREAVAHLNALARTPASDVQDDGALASALAEIERGFGAAAPARVAAPKRSLLTWYFRHAAIDGMTNPFFLEIILNPDLLPFERPFVLAHEWAHLAGYADESEANFIAWLACTRSTPPARYSGWLAAYEHVAAQLPREEREALRSDLDTDVLEDLRAIRRRLSRSNAVVRDAARGAYDVYLRANRIEEGIANYNAVVRLMLGTTLGADGVPELRR